jgi:hypothetical protein
MHLCLLLIFYASTFGSAIFFFLFYFLLFICAYKAWVISLPCPHQLSFLDKIFLVNIFVSISTGSEVSPLRLWFHLHVYLLAFRKQPALSSSYFAISLHLLSCTISVLIFSFSLFLFSLFCVLQSLSTKWRGKKKDCFCFPVC